MKDKIKDKLMNNLGMKILSLLIAIGIWVMIVDVENPVITKKFENITVNEINGDSITQKDKVYTITGGSTVDISVTGRRSFVSSLNRSDLVAYADLSKISITGATFIETQITKHTTTPYEMELGSVKVMTVELEDKASNKFPVEVELVGEVDSGYTISEKQARPNMITVSGANSVIDKINKVVLNANVQGKTSSFQKVINKNDFLVYDNNKDLIDNSKLEFSMNEITVHVEVQKTKEVELKITPVGEPKKGYRLKEFEYEPKKITVAGDEEVLKSLTSISYEYDIDGKSENYEENLAMNEDFIEAIKDYGVIPVDETASIAISIEFEKLDMKEIRINTDDIEIRNLASNLQVQFNTLEVTSLVQGSNDVLNNLSATDLLPYIDLSGYSTGTKLIRVQYDGNGEYDILNKTTINITVVMRQ